MLSVVCFKNHYKKKFSTLATSGMQPKDATIIDHHSFGSLFGSHISFGLALFYIFWPFLFDVTIPYQCMHDTWYRIDIVFSLIKYVFCFCFFYTFHMFVVFWENNKCLRKIFLLVIMLLFFHYEIFLLQPYCIILLEAYQWRRGIYI